MTARRRTRELREVPEEPTPFFCPFSAKAEELDVRLSAVEMAVASVAELHARVVRIDDDLTDEAEAAREREDDLQDRTEALERRLEAVELQAAEVEGLRQKLEDLEDEVLAVAEKALRAPADSETHAGAVVWDRLTGQQLVAVLETVVEVQESALSGGSRSHRAVGWVVRDARGCYRARAAAELTTVRPVPEVHRGCWWWRLLVGAVVAAITTLPMSALART